MARAAPDGDQRLIPEAIPPSIMFAGPMIVQVDRGDLACIQKSAFIRFRNTVVVQVAPQTKLGPNGVKIIDDAVMVNVEFSQCFKPVLRDGAIPEWSEVTEQLGATRHQAVVIPVKPEKRFIGVSFRPA